MNKVWSSFLCLTSWMLAHFACSDSFEFALIGDLPYGDEIGKVHPPYENLVVDINAQSDLKWVLHAGDFKTGGALCSDAVFEDRLNKFNQFAFPFVFTPGDNEWTDCHQKSAGAFVPLERLDTLRRMFYPEIGKTLGKTTMDVDSQATRQGFKAFRENVYWVHQDVVFATIHLVGSQNGEMAFDPAGKVSRSREDEREVEERNRAALAWLDRIFEEKDKALGLFLMIHANLGLERIQDYRDTEERQRLTDFKAPYAQFLEALETKVTEFNKPVVLAHGDSHYFRIDKPHLMTRKFHANFTRVETFAAPNYHWVKVKVDPESDEVFQFEIEIVE